MTTPKIEYQEMDIFFIHQQELLGFLHANIPCKAPIIYSIQAFFEMLNELDGIEAFHADIDHKKEQLAADNDDIDWIMVQ